MMNVPPGEIHRVEVDNAHGKYVFEPERGPLANDAADRRGGRSGAHRAARE